VVVVSCQAEKSHMGGGGGGLPCRTNKLLYAEQSYIYMSIVMS